MVQSMIGNQASVWEPRLLKHKMAEHQVQLGVMWFRDRDCEQLVLGVALFREDGLRLLPVLLLG